MLAWLTISLVVGVTIATRFVPTAGELRAAFEEGQKFYASGAYDQAIERYRFVIDSDSDLLDEKAVRVVVGEVDAPQDEVARYQIGNAFFKMATEALQSGRPDTDTQDQEGARQQVRAKADSFLALARDSFLQSEAAATVPELRSLARSRVLTCHYQMADFDGTIREAQQLLERYPESRHVEQAMYDIGWSHYEKQEYPRSIEAFHSLVSRFPGGYRANRALFQIGEAYFAMGSATGDEAQYLAAISSYGQLVASQGLESMSEREILQMKREKLAGLVDETALDLAAKALIRIGVCHERIGDTAGAAAAFERIATQFADERRLVEEAYRRTADMYYSQGDFEACIAVYRRAIAAQDDITGRARMQLLLANRYFETDHFEAAIDEYKTYAYAYDALAARVGLSLEGVGLQIARAWFGLAEGSDAESARGHYHQAELELRRTLAAWPASEFDDELRFNLGLAVQRHGGQEEIVEAIDIFSDLRARLGPAGFGRGALFQVARLRAQQGDADAAAADYEVLIQEYGEATEADLARLELGLVQATRDRETAVDILRSVRPSSAVYVRSRLEAGQLQAQHNQRQEALATFAEGLVAATGPEERSLLHYLLGATLAQQRAHEEALEHFEKAIAEAGPELQERALYGRAVTVFKLQRYSEATTFLDRLWEDDETAAAALRLRAAAHAALGETGKAMATYALLARDATEPLEQAEYHLALAEIAHQQGEYDRGITACQQLLRLQFEQQQPGADRPYFLREKALFLVVDSRIRQGDFDGARTAAAAGLAEFGDAFYAPDFLFFDGMAALQLQDHEQAEDRLQEMLRRFPGHESAPYARYYLAYTSYNRTLFEDALTRFQEVTRQTPELDVAPDAAFRIAECHYNLEQFDLAASAYRSFVESYPESPLQEDALYNIGWCVLNAVPAVDDLPNMSPVRQAFSAYLDTYPEGNYVAMAQYTLAEVYFNEGMYDQAYALFTQIDERFPGSAAAEQAGRFIPRLLEAIAYREYATITDDLNAALEANDESQLRQLIPRLEELWRKYPETATGVGAKLNIGVCYQNLEEWEAAVQAFDAIVAAGDRGNIGVTAQMRGFSERRRAMITRRHL